jgi:hypothetical protein
MPQTNRRVSFQFVTHKLRPKAELHASYCPACGLLVAASPHVDLLQFVETIHACPESFAFRPLKPSTQT